MSKRRATEKHGTLSGSKLFETTRDVIRRGADWAEFTRDELAEIVSVYDEKVRLEKVERGLVTLIAMKRSLLDVTLDTQARIREAGVQDNPFYVDQLDRLSQTATSLKMEVDSLEAVLRGEG